MFRLDIFKGLEPLSIYVVRPDNSIIGCIDNIINEQTASLEIGLNKQYTVEFDITHTDDGADLYDYVHEGMYLFIERVGLFKINQPTITLDGVKDQKHVSACSCDSELEDKTCSLSINMGTKDSQEYLVTYDNNETESLIDPYTGIPLDWILLYNMLPEQLSGVRTKLSNGYYGTPDGSGDIVVSDIDKIAELTELFSLVPRLKNKIVSTTTNNVTTSSLVEYVITTKDSNGAITSYTLNSSFDSRVAALITFYTKYRNQLSLLPIVLGNTGGGWSVGDIYGVSDGDYSLANKKFQFEINESIYAFLTQDLAKSTNCLVTFDIFNRKVNLTPIENIGEYTGVFLGYDNLVNTLNISTDEDRLATRLLVSGGDNLDISRVNFGNYYVEDLTYKMNAVNQSGERIYVSDALATKYNGYVTFRETKRSQYIQSSKDYETYSNKISELENRLPNDALKNDWSTFTLTELRAALTNYQNLLVSLKSIYKEDYGDAGLNQDGSIKESVIRQSIYWWDYRAYLSIIDEIQCAIDVFPYYGDSSQWTSAQVAQYESLIKSWETEWSLYGIVELRAKIDGFKQNMDILAEESVIRTSANSYTIKTWSNLTSQEKSSYGNNQSSYKYDLYMTYYNNMTSAQTYLNTLLSQENTLKASMENAQSQRNQIVSQVSFENYFTQDEYKILYRLLRDSTYTNDNIISTSIDSVSDKIDAMVELLNDAKEHASITSRPQLVFSVEADNLLSISEFKSLWDSFVPGNYILVQYKDNTYVRLRVIGYTFNPCLPSSSDLTIQFSNFVRSQSYYRDWASLLNSDGSGSSSGSSGGSSGGSGGYGVSDDIDVTISNTMLSKLLSSELFGTRVTDVILDTIGANVLTAKRAMFGGLADGTTTIDGKCIKTGYIIDQLYNDTGGGINNTAGSIINLQTGCFNLGAGKIKFDGFTLTVSGAITATTLSTGSRTSSATGTNGAFIDSSGNFYAGSNNQTIIYANGNLNLGNGKIVYNGSTLTVNGAITATSLSTGSRTSSATGTAGIYIDSSGNLYAGSSNQTIIYANGNINLGNGKFVYDGSTLTVNGAITATSLSTGGRTSSDTGTAGIYISSNGALYAGSDNDTIIYANGTAKLKGIVTATTFKAIGTNENSYCTIGDRLYYKHEETGVATEFIRLVEYFDTINSTKIYDVLSLWGNEITFSRTNNGSATIYYEGIGTIGVDGSLEISSGLTVDGVSHFENTCWHSASIVTTGHYYTEKGLRYVGGYDSNGAVQSCNIAGFGSTDSILYFGEDSSTTYTQGTSVRGKNVRLFAFSGGGVYLGSSGSTAVTSDETLKDIYDIDDRYVDFFNNITPVLYKYKTGHRTHIGFGAQSVENALSDAQLTTEDFAGVLIDMDIDVGEDENISPDGKTHFDELHSLRYEEFISLNTMMIKRLQSKISLLEEEIRLLKS